MNENNLSGATFTKTVDKYALITSVREKRLMCLLPTEDMNHILTDYYLLTQKKEANKFPLSTNIYNQNTSNGNFEIKQKQIKCNQKPLILQE